MLKRLNKNRISRHLTRFMHDRFTPDVKPLDSSSPKIIGNNSPKLESNPSFIKNDKKIHKSNSK